MNALDDRRAFPRSAKAPGIPTALRKARLVEVSTPVGSARGVRSAARRAGVRMSAKQKPPMRQPRANASPAFSRAAALHQQGRLEEAEGLYQAILATQPNHFDVLYRLGTLRYQQGRYPEALHYVGAALKVNPREAAAWSNLGFVQAMLGHPEEALASYDAALSLKPLSPEALNNRGNALIDLKRRDDALASYEKALALKPDYAEALNNRGSALCDLDRPAEALASLDRALALKPDYVQAHINRGNALKALGRAAEALASFAAALALRPDHPEAHDGKGLLLIELGRSSEAQIAIESAIRLAPRSARHYYNLTLSKRMTQGDPHLRAMKELAQEAPSLPLDEQIFLHFGLARAFADVGDHDRSFRHLLDGNGLKRKGTAYDEAASIGILERTRAAFTSQSMRGAEGAGDPSGAPVFIVGMPRSGTTLVEQILASHPEVFGAGEITDFDIAVAGLGGLAGGATHSPEAVARMSGDQFRRLGASYVARLAGLAPSAARITNKTPGNFSLVGLIHLALPNARFIHISREAADTCVSCFSSLFVGNLPYAYDLGELGRYYKAYDRLMAHWREALPKGVMLEVRYEELVANLEGQARRIIGHCGLEWDARSLDFHQNPRQVRTASAAQVRERIYQSSVGRWRRYRPFLAPLLAELGPSNASGVVAPENAGGLRRRLRSFAGGLRAMVAGRA